MNPFRSGAGEMPDDVMDRGLDAATVFKNFAGGATVRRETRMERHGPQGASGRREFVVEVKKPKRVSKDR